VENEMKTQQNEVSILALFSVILMLILVGWRALEVRAVAAKRAYHTPFQKELEENEILEDRLDPDPVNPVVYEPNTPVPEPTPRPPEMEPTLAPTCQGPGANIATFIKDVTIPDGSILEPGEWFTKTWRIQNVGSCTWTPAYQLAFVSGERMGAQLLVPLADISVPPGASVDVSLVLQAPEESGIYRGYWRFRSESGEPFGLTSGGSIWIEIRVVGDSPEGGNSTGDYSGYPSIEILKVSKDQTVTIKGLNFPAQDQFNVFLNYYGTQGVDGICVDSVLTGDGGEFTDTFQIPTALQGQPSLAIRLESPHSGYYAYNWFGNY
jgi:hypothetical protein